MMSAKPKAKSGRAIPLRKPLALYERIIKASSNPGDFVLDPFCGCATTPIAAERLGRKWVGIDIWDKAHETVLARLKSEGLMADESGAPDNTRLNLSFKVHYEQSPLFAQTAAMRRWLYSQRQPSGSESVTRRRANSTKDCC